MEKTHAGHLQVPFQGMPHTLWSWEANPVLMGHFKMVFTCFTEVSSDARAQLDSTCPAVLFETRHPQASKMLLPQPSSKCLGNIWEGPAPNPAGQPWCWVCWCLQTPPVLNQQCGVHSHHHHLQGKKHLCKTQLGLPQLSGASLPFPKALTELFCIMEGRIIPKPWHASCYKGSHLETQH